MTQQSRDALQTLINQYVHQHGYINAGNTKMADGYDQWLYELAKEFVATYEKHDLSTNEGGNSNGE